MLVQEKILAYFFIGVFSRYVFKCDLKVLKNWPRFIKHAQFNSQHNKNRNSKYLQKQSDSQSVRISKKKALSRSQWLKPRSVWSYFGIRWWVIIFWFFINFRSTTENDKETLNYDNEEFLI